MAMEECIAEHTQRITETFERCNNNTHRIEELEAEVKEMKNEQRALYEMAINLKNLTESVSSIKQDVKEMKTEIQEVKENPVKHKAGIVDSVSKLILTAITTGILAFILGQVCPTIFK